MPKTTESLLTEREVAKRLNISVQTLRDQRRNRGPDMIAFVQIGRSIRYELAAVQAYVKEHTRRAPGEKESQDEHR
jgi:excisionase family DNA binding protein